MAKTLWVNAFTGERLDQAVLASLRWKAQRAYQANAHIFEDERDALTAFGVVPGYEMESMGPQLAA
jgi:hypothetical protein